MAISDAERIGTLLRQERDAHGMTLGDAARAARISPLMLYRFEQGYTVPDVDTLARIFNIYTVRLSEVRVMTDEECRMFSAAVRARDNGQREEG